MCWGGGGEKADTTVTAENMNGIIPVRRRGVQSRIVTSSMGTFDTFLFSAKGSLIIDFVVPYHGGTSGIIASLGRSTFRIVASYSAGVFPES